MAGSFFYNLLTPFNAVDIPAITMLTTDLPLVPATNLPLLPNFFAYPGKTLRIELFGRITTVLTPGNLTWDIYWGSGAAANGVLLASSAAQALTASQTNVSWMATFDIECRAIGGGSLGLLFATGIALMNEAVEAPHMLIPATAPVVSAAVDLSASNTVSVQAKRSGSTAETMQVHKVKYFEVN
jgi:hypothetical protein